MEPFWFVAALVMMLPQIEKEEEEKRKEPKANASEKAEREGILNEK
jgi:hypothetical protein